MSACVSVCIEEKEKWLPRLQTNWRDSGLVLETNCTIVVNTHAISMTKTRKNADSNASFSNITAAAKFLATTASKQNNKSFESRTIC